MRFRTALIGLTLAGAAFAADQSVAISVDNWHSKGDGYKLEQAVRAVKGVQSANADSTKKVLTVVFDNAATSEAQVRKAITDAGYSSR